MLRRFVFLLTLLAAVSPAWGEQVDVKHPLLKEPATGLYVDGKAYVSIDTINQILPGTFTWDGAKKVITGYAQPMPAQGAKSILFVGEAASPVLKALKGQGMAVEQSASLPDAPEAYAALVIADATSYGQIAAEQLDRYVSQGGGLVLLGYAPNGFTPQNRASVTEWLGSVRVRPWGQKGIRSGCAVSHPFKTDLKRGARIYGTGDALARVGFVPLSELAPQAQPVLSIAYGGPDQPGSLALIGAGPTKEPIAVKTAKGCLAYSYPYGKGRVYWQSIFDTATPRLTELFLGAARWAGGFVEAK